MPSVAPLPHLSCRPQVSQHPHVRSAIEAVHAGIAQRAPHLEKVCVEAASAHLTLGVMALGSAEERSRAGKNSGLQDVPPAKHSCPACSC